MQDGPHQRVAELGLALDAAFERADFDERAFPELAARALEEAALPERLTAADVARFALEERALPEQDDPESRFGQPAITLFHGRRFSIQVLFWVDDTTAIHRHGFSGAFQVLEGSSVHSEHDFVPERAVNAHMQIGRVRFRRATLLARGDVVEITTGLAHNLFHLDRPSATLVVRTYSEPAGHPQFNYLPPHLAVDPSFRDPVLNRRLQVLEMLRATDEAGYESSAADLLGRCDLQTAWHVLEQAGAALPGSPRLAALVQAAGRRHGAIVADRLVPSIAAQLRRRRIQRLRQDVRDPEQRFFLALLLNVPDRDGILGMIAARYPAAPPRSLVDGWLESLSGTDRIGVDLANPLNRTLLGALLDGLPDEAVVARVRDVFDPADVEAKAPELAAHLARVRRSVLEPLFTVA